MALTLISLGQNVAYAALVFVGAGFWIVYESYKVFKGNSFLFLNSTLQAIVGTLR